MFTDIASKPGTIAVTTTATMVLPRRQWRQSLIIQNTSVGTVYVGYGPGVTAANGIQIKTDGVFRDDRYTGPVYAVASVAADIPYIEVGVNG